MPIHLNSLLPRLKSHVLPGIDLTPGIIHPFYDGFSLANLPTSICAWLGASAPFQSALHPAVAAPQPGPFRHIILILVDGLGLNQLTHYIGEQGEKDAFWHTWLDDASLYPLTSIAPSTTSAALTTLWTGVPPAQHGIIGYEMWLKEYGLVANTLQHSPSAFNGDPGSLRRAGFNPETFLPVPALGAHLDQEGITTFCLQPNSIARSGLSSMLLAGAESIPYRSQADLWVTLSALQSKHASEKTYTYVYWADLDELGHRYGPADERLQLEFCSLTRYLERFLTSAGNNRQGETLLILTADHGLIATPIDLSLDLHRHPAFLSNLSMLPSGEHRLASLFPRSGDGQKVQDYIKTAWPGRFHIYPAETILASGLLGPGPVYPPVLDRLGDFVAIPEGNAYWWWADKENLMLGRHGGLSEDEMLIPLVLSVF